MATSGKPPFRADVVGSLLRPPVVHEARAKRQRGEIDAAALRRIEDDCIREAVAMQEAVGLKVATDGEFHRGHWLNDFVGRIEGIAITGGLPAKFHNEQGDVEFTPSRFEIRGRLRRSRGLATEDFAFLNSVATVTAKQSIPSPMCLHFRGGRAAIDQAVYPDIEDFFADLVQVYREEIRALYDLGCRYLQIDDTNFPYLCDPKLRAHVRSIGENPDTLPKLYARLMNETIRDRPADLAVCMHMCRGNFASAWVAEGGYDPIAEVVFGEIAVDGFFLEYDSPRAGGFEPLRFVSGDKVAVLGLVTTKKPELEAKDALKRRIDAASRHIPLDRLALSPQCGFASTIEGNKLSIDDEKAKLRLVVETAEEVWGTAA